MVRRCCVHECSSSDKSILAHRFPKTIAMAVRWQKALDLQRHPLDELQKRFVVCTKHFAAASYRNEISNCLNTTSVPNLNDNLCNERVNIKNFSKRPHETAINELDTEVEGPSKRIKEQSELIVAVEELETFEIREYSEASTESAVIVEDLSDGIENQDDDVLTGSLLIEHPDDTETFKEIPKEILKCDQGIQTETPVIDKPVMINKSFEDEQDVKMISILYPEYQGLKKIELIEIVNEKNRKIESLEEKVKKLELAVRNLF